MASYRLTGPEIEQLRDLLRGAFTRPRFDELLLYRLDRHLDDYASPADDYRTALRRVIVEANAGLWWSNLLLEARQAVPQDAGLQEFADRFGLSPQVRAVERGALTAVPPPNLELRIRAAGSTFDVALWRKRLGQIEGRVCRIEFPPTNAQGTGFLVGPDVVLTNYHVVEKIAEGKLVPGLVSLRFDYKVAEEGVEVHAGTVFRLADDWLVDRSPYSPCDFELNPATDPKPDELDYALLRVAGRPGEQPVGGETRDVDPPVRSWVALPAVEHDFALRRALYIVQHPDGAPMQVAVDSEAVIGMNGNGTRVRYTTTTLPGSSGSPCFGPDWNPVALHQAGDPKYLHGQFPEFNQGVPLTRIRELLTERGRNDVLGAPV